MPDFAPFSRQRRSGVQYVCRKPGFLGRFQRRSEGASLAAGFPFGGVAFLDRPQRRKVPGSLSTLLERRASGGTRTSISPRLLGHRRGKRHELTWRKKKFAEFFLSSPPPRAASPSSLPLETNTLTVCLLPHQPRRGGLKRRETVSICKRKKREGDRNRTRSARQRRLTSSPLPDGRHQ